MVLSPAVAIIGTFSDFGSTIVNGPGKNESINKCADEEISVANKPICSTLATCAINGLSCGRSFASNIFAMACSSKTFAPSPYTVSVGNATTPPRLTNPAAFWGEIVITVCTKAVSPESANNAKEDGGHREHIGHGEMSRQKRECDRACVPCRRPDLNFIRPARQQ